MIKIGQIGIGHNHSDKLKVIRKHPELFELIGYAEDNEQWITRRSNKAPFEGVPRLSEDALLEQCDAILVETDVWNLTKTAQKCVDAGKHIHMDKPASGTLQEYKQLLDTAEKKNLVVQLGYMYRYNPAVLKLLDMVQKGELGDIYSINAEMSIVHRDAYRCWLRNFKGGDLYIFGSHLIDLIVFLLGKPNNVLSSVVASNKNGVEAPDLTTAILEYDHALARVFSSSVEWNGWARRTFSVSGSLGTAHIQPIEDPCVMTFTPAHPGKSLGQQTTIPIDLPPQSNATRYDDMLLDFYACITDEKENPFSYAHEYAVQEVLDQAVGGIACLGNQLEQR